MEDYINIIAGAGRVGKTTLAKSIREDAILAFEPLNLIHLDSLSDALVDTGFWAVDSVVNFGHEDNFEEKVDQVMERDNNRWVIFQEYLKLLQRDIKDNYMVNTVSFWPRTYHETHLQHINAVWLVDTSYDEQLERLTDCPPADSWVHRYRDEYLEKWVKFNIARSRRIKKQAHKRGLPCFDVGELGIAEAHDKARMTILEGMERTSWAMQ